MTSACSNKTLNFIISALLKENVFYVLSLFTGSFSSFIFGTVFSWTSPSIPRLTSLNGPYHFTMEECSYLTIMQSLATIIAAFIYPRLSDAFGRKITLLSIAIPYTLPWLLLAFSSNIYSFYVARFIGGLGDACIFSVLPSYIGEVATPKIRGIWGNSIVCYFLVGQVYINIVCGYLGIKTAALINLVNSAIFVFTFIFAPESPYYYIMKGRKEDARASLQKLRRIENVDEELAAIELATKRQMSESCKWKELLTVKSNRRAITAGVFLRTMPYLAGISVSPCTRNTFFKSVVEIYLPLILQ